MFLTCYEWRNCSVRMMLRKLLIYLEVQTRFSIDLLRYSIMGEYSLRCSVAKIVLLRRRQWDSLVIMDEGMDSLMCFVKNVLLLRFVNMFCLECDIEVIKKPHQDDLHQFFVFKTSTPTPFTILKFLLARGISWLEGMWWTYLCSC